MTQRLSDDVKCQY